MAQLHRNIKVDKVGISYTNVSNTSYTNYNLFGYSDEDHTQLTKKYKEVKTSVFKLQDFKYGDFEILLTNIIKKDYPMENNISGFVLDEMKTKGDFYTNMVDIVKTNKDLIKVLDYPD